jgi:LSD1 subclass zinc finger protein
MEKLVQSVQPAKAPPSKAIIRLVPWRISRPMPFEPSENILRLLIILLPRGRVGILPEKGSAGRIETATLSPRRLTKSAPNLAYTRDAERVRCASDTSFNV